MSNNQLMRNVPVPKQKPPTRIHSSSSTDQEQPAIIHELDRNVLAILRQKGPVTRSKLVQMTGVARTTLYDSLVRLILIGYVTRFSEDRKQRGRPKVYFQAVF